MAPLWIKTPLIHSPVLSEKINSAKRLKRNLENGNEIAKDDNGYDTLLKLELFQPSGSFKSRGIGNLILQKQHNRNPAASEIHLFSSSGGNAGLATATAANSLGLACTVIVPNSASKFMIDKIKRAGADVHVHGDLWSDADREVRRRLKDINSKAQTGESTVEAVYCPPFDDPYIWHGNSTIVQELSDQIEAEYGPGARPEAIICSVGGGGLCYGLVEGIRDIGWANDVPILAVETEGMSTLATSIKRINAQGGDDKSSAEELAKMAGIKDDLSGIATCLASPYITAPLLEAVVKGESVGPKIKSVIVSDSQAATACVDFADDHRMIVESACGASLSVAYNQNGLLEKSLNDMKKKLHNGTSSNTIPKLIVVIVCGGSSVNTETLLDYKKKFCTSA